MVPWCRTRDRVGPSSGGLNEAVVIGVAPVLAGGRVMDPESGLFARCYASCEGKALTHDGADADIAVLDPARVIDRATFEDPAQPSERIAHVLVARVFVVRDGSLVDGGAPGGPVLRRAP